MISELRWCDAHQLVPLAAFDDCSIGVAMVVNGAVAHANTGLARLLGVRAGSLAGAMFAALLDFPAGGGRLELVRADGETLRLQGTPLALDAGQRVLWLVRERGDEYSSDACGCDELKRQNAWLRQALEERTRAEQHSRHAACHDALTGLANRALLDERLAHALQMARRQHRGMALMFIDLDRLKLVNDTFGHAAGDRLLCAVAQRLLHAVRATDLVARIGGDEFVVLLEESQPGNGAMLAARKVLEALSAPLQLGECLWRPGASIGISQFPEHGADAATLLRHADIAMYQAKAGGRNAIRLFETTFEPGFRD